MPACTIEEVQGTDDQFGIWLRAGQPRPAERRELKGGLAIHVEADAGPTDDAQGEVPSSCSSSSFFPIKNDSGQAPNVALSEGCNDSGSEVGLIPRAAPSEMTRYQDQHKLSRWRTIS